MIVDHVHNLIRCTTKCGYSTQVLKYFLESVSDLNIYMSY